MIYVAFILFLFIHPWMVFFGSGNMKKLLLLSCIAASCQAVDIVPEKWRYSPPEPAELFKNREKEFMKPTKKADDLLFANKDTKITRNGNSFMYSEQNGNGTSYYIEEIDPVTNETTEVVQGFAY